MFKEYDIVESKKTLENVPVGCMGTILMVYQNSRGYFYEVEFVDDSKETIAVLTVSEADIRALDK